MKRAIQFSIWITFVCIFLSLKVYTQESSNNPNVDNTVGLPLPSFQIIEEPRDAIIITSSDGFDNFDLSKTNAEPHMSSNPLNPLWIFTAFNMNSTFRTIDGHSWIGSIPNFDVPAKGDPVTAYDNAGNLYYETMFGTPIQGAKVIRSTDNGATWTSAVTAISGYDKNWITCDQTNGPYANYVYTTMTGTADNGSAGGNFARSIDNGATWTTTFHTPPNTHSDPGMMVAVGPNVLNGNNISGGCVYVVANGGSQHASVYTFFVSTDGGLTFIQKSSNQFSNYVGTLVSTVNETRLTVHAMRTRPYPMIAADNSLGTYRGRLYLVYASNNPSGNGNKSDIFLRYSTDQGATWSSAKIVNDDINSESNYQFHPAIWCDKETGRLYIHFYDTRRVPTSDSMDVYVTYTDDGGETFATNQRLTNQTFKINFDNATYPIQYRGDYNAVTSNQYSSMAVWTDFRNNNFLGMTAYFPDFAMRVTPSITLSQIDSKFINVVVPDVKLYTHTVTFSATVTPTNISVSFPMGNTLSAYPDSIPLQITAAAAPARDYAVTIIGKGPNGTPVHKRTIIVTVKPSVQVTVDQKYTGGITSVGSIGRWQGWKSFVPYTAPKQFKSYDGAHEVLQGTQEIISGRKYYKWDIDYTITNHRDFTIGSGNPNELQSNLELTYTGITIKNKLIDVPSHNGGTIDFHDPWLIDYPDPLYSNNKRNQGMVAPLPFKSRSSPFYPDYTTTYNGDVYQGVFFEQDPDFIPVYYSVKAPQTQTIGSYPNCNFLAWNTSGQTQVTKPTSLESPVIFRGANDVVEALYKGQLISSISTALSSNSQRKILRHHSTITEVIYESGGGIFTNRTSNSGTTWEGETVVDALPNSGYQYRSPSIEADDDGITVNSVWERVRQNAVWEHSIKTNTGISIDYTTNVDVKATPVFSHGNGFYALVWRNNTGLQFRISWSSGYYQTNIPYSTPTSANPVLVTDYVTGSPEPYRVNVVWSEGTSGIMFTQCKFSAIPVTSSNHSWSTPISIDTEPGMNIKMNSTMVRDYSGNLCIAWEARNTTTTIGKIKFQKRDKNGLLVANSEKEFVACSGSANYPTEAVLSHHRNSLSDANGLVLAWKCGGNKFAFSLYDGLSNGWIPPSFLYNGQNLVFGQAISISESKISNDNTTYVVILSSSGPPYQLQMVPLPSAGQILSTPTVTSPNNVTDVPSNTVFHWSSVAGATFYNLRIATDENMNNIFKDYSKVPGTQWTVYDLAPGIPYWWQVQASNCIQTTVWSASGWFQTDPCVDCGGGGGGGAGCPFIYVWNGEEFIEDNNILPQSEYKGNYGNDVVDYYKLLQPLDESGNTYKLQIREFEHEKSFLDQVRMLVVEHPANTGIAVDEYGEVRAYHTPSRMNNALLGENDVVDKLIALDTSFVKASKRDNLFVNFNVPPGLSDRNGGVLLAGTSSGGGDKKISLGKVGNYTSLTAPALFTFRQRPTVTYIPFGELASTEFTLDVDERVDLNYVNLAFEKQGNLRIREAQLQRAVHSNHGIVSSALRDTGDQRVVLQPGETVELNFSQFNLPPGKQHSFILMTTGRYERLPIAHKLSTQAVPTFFELEQNYPNPFNPQTTIRYQLAEPSVVRVSIYNVVGQEIAVITNAKQDAGYYSATWNGAGNTTGVYYLRMVATDDFGKPLYQEQKKLLLMK